MREEEIRDSRLAFEGERTKYKPGERKRALDEELAKVRDDNIIGIEACLIGFLAMKKGGDFHEEYHKYMDKASEMDEIHKRDYFVRQYWKMTK